MTQMMEPAIQVPTRGRQTKFTPERIRQIKNLVEQGTSREKIAELIGCTVGSLQVTCSRLGVSLRRPKLDIGAGLRRNGGIAGHNPDVVPLQLTKEAQENSPSASVEQAQVTTGSQAATKRTSEVGTANFAIRMQYRGQERTTQLPLTQDVVRQLAFEAEFRNMRIGDFVGEVIVAMLKKDLLQTVLEQKKSA
jgi:Helix-turn-helix domain of resolvase